MKMSRKALALAETGGFEPPMRCNTHNGLANPLGFAINWRKAAPMLALRPREARTEREQYRSARTRNRTQLAALLICLICALPAAARKLPAGFIYFSWIARATAK